MPELPEVQTIVQELQAILPGKELVAVEELYRGTVRNTVADADKSFNVAQHQQGRIIAVYRRGKYIVINLNSSISLVIHLRMTGKLIYCHQEDSQKASHIRALLHFADGTTLIFNDPRTFGKIDIIKTSSINRFFSKLGCEPLTKKFNFAYLKGRFTKSKVSVKKALLNQNIIAGIGNIYACEILYLSKMDPLKVVSALSDTEIRRLIKATKSVLIKAISCNGTTISDYRRVDDKQGSFQDFLQVYGKTTCPIKHSVIRVKMDGRSTYYCPECQK